MRISDVLIRLIGARDPNCPNEADVLAYSENRLSTRNRAGIERHFASCDDCRQVLVFLGREAETTAPVTEEAVSQQTDRVLDYIRRDERNSSRSLSKARAATGFYISYPRLAAVGLIICAIAAGGVFVITRGQSPADAAMASLRLGLKNARFTEARISGGFDQSRYTGTIRGNESSNDDLHLNRAENKVRSAAEQETATVNNRLVLARIYLARGTRESATKALAILNQVATRGLETPEVLNDIGVAHLQLDNYDDAIAFLNKALAKSPAYNEALFNLALAEELARRNEDARRDWQKFINQSSDEKWKSEARNHLESLGDATNR